MTIQQRRAILTLWTVDWNASINMISTLASKNPAWRPGAIGFLRAIITATEIAGDMNAANAARDALKQIGNLP